MKRLLFLTIVSALMACGADDNTNPNPRVTGEWSIESRLVLDGGVGQDGIPSIDDPNFISVEEVTFLNDFDLVLAYRSGNTIKAYPHPILDWHEIVNDQIGNDNIALTYCPLTGTGIGWDRMVDGQLTTFGVSGLLYNSNLMPYDRLTESIWSQQRLDCVNGDQIREKATLYSFFETNWGTFKEAYPDAQVLSRDTGASRDYTVYPYGDYRENDNNLIAPIVINDDRLPRKERTLGVRLNETFKIYPFGEALGQELIQDRIDGVPVTVLSHRSRNYLVAFEGHDFTELPLDDFPFVVADSNGVRYDVFGHSDDPAMSPLELPVQFIGYWFSWGTFYENVALYQR